MNKRKNAFQKCIPFDKSPMYLSSHGQMLDDYINFLLSAISKPMNKPQREQFVELLTLIKTTHALENQYFFNCGWDAAKEQSTPWIHRRP